MSTIRTLDGQTALVTGASRGIGRAVALALAEAGAEVVVNYSSSPDAADAVVGEITGSGGRAYALQANVADEEAVNDLIKTVIERSGRIDVLVNNAGINVPRLLVDPAGKEELTEEIWDKVFAVNVKGQFLCAQAATRRMLENEQGGVLINMSSESGLEGSEGQSAYAATKAANQNLTRSWAKELGNKGVRVIGVAPGIMETTGMRSEAYEQSLAYTRGISVDELRSKYGSTSSIPLGRSGKLSEVADLVVFLASERASYLHGTTVNISGGKSRG